MPSQDKKQKNRDERDEDERDEDEREEEEDEDESDDASDDDDDDDDESESDAKASKSGASDASDDDDEDRDAAAQRVAKALGVADDEDGEAKEEAEAAAEDKPEEVAKPNRAARRREEALARRKKREGSSSNEEDEPVAKDKNARAKELLKRRREQAASAARAPAAASSLDAGEMVDDVLARTTAAIGKWFRTNVQVIQWIVLVGLVGSGGYVLYNMRVEKKAGEASARLLAGIAADRGIVLEEDKRSDDEKEFDTRRVFKTTGERADAALGSFNKVIEQHGGSGAALLAKLGQAGAYLEKKEFDKAIATYSEVLSSPLAAADPDVKGQTIEGTAFAKEGKGELDAAIASAKELASIDVKGYKELATYHEARLLFAKGDKAKAKELLEPLNTKLTTPSPEPQPYGHLKSAVSDLFTQIDPGAAAAAANKPAAPGKMPTQQELQDMARRAQEAIEQKAPPKNGTP